MPILFKDYEKDINDFFDKNYLKGTKGFKFESKGKGPDRTIYVNNAFDDGVFTTSFQYDIKEHGLKTKFGLTNKGKGAGKITFEKGYSCGSHKFELNDSFQILNVFDWSGDFAHEWKVGPAAMNSKTKLSCSKGPCSDAAVSVEVPGVKGLHLGATTSVDVCKKALGAVKVGGQYKDPKGCQIAGSADQNGTYTIGLMTSCKNLFGMNSWTATKGFGDFTWVAQMVQTAKDRDVKFGFSTVCPLTGGRGSFKANLAGNYGLSTCWSFPNKVCVSIGCEGSLKDCCKCPCDKLAVSVVSE